MLQVKNLKVKVGGKEIVKDISLEIPKGKIYVLFGPNGSGKSTFLMAILGFSKYKTEGKIIFKGKDISKLSPDKRAKMGIGIAFQRPPAISGLVFKDLIKIYSSLNKKELKRKAKELMFDGFFQREINKGMSGGEIKRGEVFQVLSQNPDLLLLDEPESGVDIENIEIIGKALKKFLSSKEKSALIITHTGSILKYLKADKGFVMVDGKISCAGDPKAILKTIKKVGYQKCFECHKKRPEK